MIKIINLSKSFGKQEIFDNISFNINRGERAGLTGRNGHGKTTLFRIITGEDFPDSGEIFIPGDYTIGYLKQNLTFTEKTVLKECCKGLPLHQKKDKWKAEKILSGLGFTSEDMNRAPGLFSGGFQVRLNLAKVLVSEPDLLLLDEPTNYLDIVSIRWLTNYLKQWRNELMLITHDRGFMDSVVTTVIGIHRKKIKKISGDTGKLYNQILKEEEIYEKTRINDDKKRKEVQQFIKRFRAKARLAGLVQSRIKALEKKEKLHRLEKIKSLEFSFAYKPFNAKTLMRIDNITFSYDKNRSPLIKNLTLTVGSNDRICIIGKNGKGKTTLLRLLAEELKPDSGEIHSHNNTVTGYYAQTNTNTLKDSLTIEEELMDSGADKQKARNICGAMMFEGDDALKKISVLSGGEKCRVLLGKLLTAPSNLLLLDEPTNHLDMESTDAFMAAIDSFEGAAIIVTHNETFLHTLATRFIVFRGNEVSVFEGSYGDFLEKKGWRSEDTDLIKNNKKATEEKPQAALNKKNRRKLKAEIISRRSKELKPLEEKISSIEDLIESKESELSSMNTNMIEASASGDSVKITELSKSIHLMRSHIDLLYKELEELTANHDIIKKKLDDEMHAIEQADQKCS